MPTGSASVAELELPSRTAWAPLVATHFTARIDGSRRVATLIEERLDRRRYVDMPLARTAEASQSFNVPLLASEGAPVLRLHGLLKGLEPRDLVRSGIMVILASFHRQGLLRRCATFRCWIVERRWSEAFSDLELDEQMCRCVAIHLAGACRGRLRTRVISYVV